MKGKSNEGQKLRFTKSCGGTALIPDTLRLLEGATWTGTGNENWFHHHENGDVLTSSVPLERKLLEHGRGTGYWNLSYWNWNYSYYSSLELELCSFSGYNL